MTTDIIVLLQKAADRANLYEKDSGATSFEISLLVEMIKKTGYDPIWAHYDQTVLTSRKARALTNHLIKKFV